MLVRFAENGYWPWPVSAVIAKSISTRSCGIAVDEAGPPASPITRGRPASAIAAGYLGLLALFPFSVSRPAMIAGVIALRTLKGDPELKGRG